MAQPVGSLLQQGIGVDLRDFVLMFQDAIATVDSWYEHAHSQGNAWGGKGDFLR